MCFCSSWLIGTASKQIMGCKEWKNCPNTWNQVTCDQCGSKPRWSVYHNNWWLKCEVLGCKSVRHFCIFSNAKTCVGYLAFLVTESFLLFCSYGLVKSYNMPCAVESASLEPKYGNKFVTGGEDMWVRVFDFFTGEELGTLICFNRLCRNGRMALSHVTYNFFYNFLAITFALSEFFIFQPFFHFNYQRKGCHV